MGKVDIKNRNGYDPIKSSDKEDIPGFGFPWRGHEFSTTRQHEATEKYWLYSGTKKKGKE